MLLNGSELDLDVRYIGSSLIYLATNVAKMFQHEVVSFVRHRLEPYMIAECTPHNEHSIVKVKNM